MAASPWLGSDEDPAVEFATIPPRVASPESFLESAVTKSPEDSIPSRRPTISSSSGSRYSSWTESLSRKLSASTAASSVSLGSFEDNRAVDPPVAPTLPAADYYLHCELLILGCNVAFLPSDREAWILHSLSHFESASPPANIICTICDDAVFEATSDPISNWRKRMHHLADHFQNGYTFEQSRPVYALYKYLAAQGLLSDDDFKNAMSYTERPRMETLVTSILDIPNTSASERRSERAVVQVYSKRTEDRQRQLRRLKKNAGLNNAGHTAT